MSTYINDEIYQKAVMDLANTSVDPLTGKPDQCAIKTILGELLDVWPQSIRYDVAMRGDFDVDLESYVTRTGNRVQLDLDAWTADSTVAAHEPTFAASPYVSGSLVKQAMTAGGMDGMMKEAERQAGVWQKLGLI